MQNFSACKRCPNPGIVVLQIALKILTRIPMLCSPDGVVVVLPSILYMILGVLRESSLTDKVAYRTTSFLILLRKFTVLIIGLTFILFGNNQLLYSKYLLQEQLVPDVLFGHISIAAATAMQVIRDSVATIFRIFPFFLKNRYSCCYTVIRL